MLFLPQAKVVEEGRVVEVQSPEGHTFRVVNEDIKGPNPVSEITLNVEDLEKSLGEQSNDASYHSC